MKICFNTATSGDHHRLEKVLDALGRAGYDGIEIDTGRLDDALTRMSIEDLKERIQGNGLEVAALMAFGLVVFEDRTEALARIGRLCVTLFGRHPRPVWPLKSWLSLERLPPRRK